MVGDPVKTGDSSASDLSAIHEHPHHGILDDAVFARNILFNSLRHPLNPLREVHAIPEREELFRSEVFQGVGVPTGNDANVFTLPGFWMGDHHLRYLNGFLTRIGYNVHESGIRHDIPPFERTIRLLADNIKMVNDITGVPSILVPHSVAGPIATHISMTIPGDVEFQVDLAPVYNSSVRVTWALLPVVFATVAYEAVTHGPGSVHRDIGLLQELDEHDTSAGPVTQVSHPQGTQATPKAEDLVGVRHVILRAMREGVITNPDRETPHGAVVYDVDATHDGMLASKSSFTALAQVLRAHEDSKKTKVKT